MECQEKKNKNMKNSKNAKLQQEDIDNGIIYI